MLARPVEKIFEEYKTAVSWVKSIVSDIPENSRMYEYLKHLELTVEENAKNISSPKSLLLILETNQHSSFLVGLHKKFKTRTEKPFLEKLRTTLFGPVYTHREVLTAAGPSRNPLARNIESELIMASRVAHPEIVTFEGGDVIYELGYYKFGMEVKRVHSLEKVIQRFREGCEQVQRNAAVRYGAVAFRFDKHFFVTDQGSLRLMDRGQSILTFDSPYRCERAVMHQTQEFAYRYGSEMMKIAYEYPKVQGVFVFALLPFSVGGEKLPAICGHLRSVFRADDIKSQTIITNISKEFDSSPYGVA
jgi:hypothetical protein